MLLTANSVTISTTVYGCQKELLQSSVTPAYNYVSTISNQTKTKDDTSNK